MLWCCFLRKLLILQLALQILRLHDTRDRHRVTMRTLAICQVRACARCVVFKKQVPPSTDTSKVLYLKGFWTFRVCADVSHCFHSASTGAYTTTGVADTTAGTAVSQKNAERFSENGERFFLATAILPLATADTATR